MNSISIKVLLVLTALAFICHAQQNQAGQQCLCASFKNTVDSKKNISDVQIYPSTNFCNQVEIIITNKNGARYCLNPNLKVAKALLNRIIRARK
ncbi:C-X-C motif chemokine 11-1-like [Eucyclogobius newberryi]|uniref:C-X-C motif chemokine 11-1-like n=1 Tax=Eucyclogobius newberryi TaxID=166745 RepID=UPI003B5B32F5